MYYTGEELPVVNVTQLEKDTILVCFDSKYFLYYFNAVLI